MDKILGMLGKKFLTNVLGLVMIPVISALNTKLHLGLTDDQIMAMIGVSAAYILVQGSGDIASKGATSSVIPRNLNL